MKDTITIDPRKELPVSDDEKLERSYSSVNVLIIGGTGSIGPYVVRELAAEGHNITLFNRDRSRSELPAGVQRITGDRIDLLSFKEEFKRIGPEVVVDMCAFREREALDLMNAFRGIASRVVVISSQDVYRNNEILWKLAAGEPDPVPSTEESRLRNILYIARSRASSPEDLFYDYEKIDVERVVMQDSAISATVLRLPMVYGPGDRAHRMFPYLKRMDDGRHAILINDAAAEWLWTRGFVEDVAHAIALAVVDSRAAGVTYNVGEPDPMSELDWIGRIARAAGWTGEIVRVPDELMPGHLRIDLDWRCHLVADTSRIRSELGYSESLPTQTRLERTVEWERANPPDEIALRLFDYPAEDQCLETMRRPRSEPLF
jgi:nucleoside-diphosphate-sugar epimerase